MKLRLLLILLVLCAIFIFPQKVRAAEEGTLYILDFDREGQPFWQTKPVDLPLEESMEEQAQALFEALLADPDLGFMPENVQVLGTFYAEGHLFVNLSQAITQYGGGYTEKCLTAQLANTGFSLSGVESVTLLVEGQLTYLPEGTLPVFSHAVKYPVQ